jgi:hypothetical protein
MFLTGPWSYLPWWVTLNFTVLAGGYAHLFLNIFDQILCRVLGTGVVIEHGAVPKGKNPERQLLRSG